MAEGELSLKHVVLLCSTSVSTAFVASLLQGNSENHCRMRSQGFKSRLGLWWAVLSGSLKQLQPEFLMQRWGLRVLPQQHLSFYECFSLRTGATRVMIDRWTTKICLWTADLFSRTSNSKLRVKKWCFKTMTYHFGCPKLSATREDGTFCVFSVLLLLCLTSTLCVLCVCSFPRGPHGWSDCWLQEDEHQPGQRGHAHGCQLWGPHHAVLTGRFQSLVLLPHGWEEEHGLSWTCSFPIASRWQLFPASRSLGCFSGLGGEWSSPLCCRLLPVRVVPGQPVIHLSDPSVGGRLLQTPGQPPPAPFRLGTNRYRHGHQQVRMSTKTSNQEI